jgi:hypothetical protein
MLNRPLQRVNVNGTWIAPAMQIQHGLFAGHRPETFSKPVCHARTGQ